MHTSAETKRRTDEIVTGGLTWAPIAARNDRLTIAAVAIVVHALSSLLHEGVGHGGACLAVHGVPRLLTSMEFRCDLPELASSARRILAAGGTIATLAGGSVALALYVAASQRFVTWRYALWLFAAVNLMQGTGYFFYSGVSGIGDWAAVTAGLQPTIAWRVFLAVGGFTLYWMTTAGMFRVLDPFLGDAQPERYRRALVLATLPYLVGGGLSVVAGLSQSAGWLLVVISGAAASFGGTSGLAWGPQLVRRTTASGAVAAPQTIERSWGLVVIAIIVASAFVLVLGRGIQLSG